MLISTALAPPSTLSSTASSLESPSPTLISPSPSLSCQPAYQSPSLRSSPCPLPSLRLSSSPSLQLCPSLSPSPSPQSCPRLPSRPSLQSSSHATLPPFASLVLPQSSSLRSGLSPRSPPFLLSHHHRSSSSRPDLLLLRIDRMQSDLPRDGRAVPAVLAASHHLLRMIPTVRRLLTASRNTSRYNRVLSIVQGPGGSGRRPTLLRRMVISFTLRAKRLSQLARQLVASSTAAPWIDVMNAAVASLAVHPLPARLLLPSWRLMTRSSSETMV
mmetsp:Transcript_33622/g.75914  ORF Transcript_33622/g.75914 Transcript_33622/m.75914 type:complete len:272 (+) Transcript_33622:1760-2575(+)